MSVLKARVGGSWVEVGGIMPVASTNAVYLTMSGTVPAPAGSLLASWSVDPASTPGTSFNMSSPTRIQVLVAGWYSFQGQQRFDSIAIDQRSGGEIRLNSGGVITGGTRIILLPSAVNPSGTGAVVSSVALSLWLNANDYVEFFTTTTDPDGCTTSAVLGVVHNLAVKGDKGDTGSGSTVTVQEEGVSKGTRPTINFQGSIFSATDDAANNRINVAGQTNLVNFQGAWTAQAYGYADVVQQFGSYWIWQSGTPSLSTDAPGVGSNSWWQLSGVAIMTPAEITAWTGAHTGNVAQDSSTDEFMVRYSSSWQKVNPRPSLVQAALGTVAAGTNDQTLRTLYTTAALTAAGLLSVAINCYVQQTGTGVCEYYMIAEIMRGGSSIGNIAGQTCRSTLWATAPMHMKINFQWADARVGDTVRVNFQRVTAANTFQVGLSGTHAHGIQWTLQPY